MLHRSTWGPETCQFSVAKLVTVTGRNTTQHTAIAFKTFCLDPCRSHKHKIIYGRTALTGRGCELETTLGVPSTGLCVCRLDPAELFATLRKTEICLEGKHQGKQDTTYAAFCVKGAGI